MEQAPPVGHNGGPAPDTRGLERALSRWFPGLAVGLTLLLAAVLFIPTVAQWRTFSWPDSEGHATAFYNQNFYLAVRDGWFHSTMARDRLYHGALQAEHFSPNFYLFLPAYALWQSPLLLLLLTSLAVAAGGFAVLLAARRIFGSAAVALIWFGLYALHPQIPWTLFVNGFREIFVAAGFLGLALLFYLRDDRRLFVLMMALAVLSKEDVALVLPVWGVVAWLQGRGRRLAGSMVLAGIAYFLAVNFVALPLLRGAHPGHVYFVGLTSRLGDTPGDILHSIRSAPAGLAHEVLSGRDRTFWASIFGPLLFLPLLGWEYFVIPAYVYAEIALVYRLQDVLLPYIFPALPFLFVAAMTGTVRLIGFLDTSSLSRVFGAPAVRRAGLAALLCGLAGSTVYSTTLPSFLRWYWFAETRLPQPDPLFRALAQIPVRASLAATDGLIAEGSSRRALYDLPGDIREPLGDAHEPDYIAIGSRDPHMDAPEARGWIASVLCGGAYGVVYDGHAWFGRILLARGAELSANRRVYETLFPGSRRECPAPAQAPMGSEIFERLARLHVHTRFPSEVGAGAMLPAPVTALSASRFAQVVYLPDHMFAPGRYRIDLVGAWPWGQASDRVTARVLVGGRAVGRVAAGGDQPLRYITPPFRIPRRETLPVRVRIEVRAAAERAGRSWALRPTREACAIVADAASLNPQRLSVEALIYLDGMLRRPGALAEAPILTKNGASGYDLRLAGNDRGALWVNFSVAGRAALGQAGLGAVPPRRWTAIAATYDGREVRVYIDGRQAFQNPFRSPRYAGVVRSQGAPLAIGCDPQRRDGPIFPGRIAAARIWSRALTAQEIRQAEAMWPFPAGGASGLVGSWGFQSTTDGVIPDLSGTGHPITNARQLLRVSAPDLKPPFAAWRSRELNLLRRVTVRSAGQ